MFFDLLFVKVRFFLRYYEFKIKSLKRERHLSYNSEKVNYLRHYLHNYCGKIYLSHLLLSADVSFTKIKQKKLTHGKVTCVSVDVKFVYALWNFNFTQIYILY